MEGDALSKLKRPFRAQLGMASKRPRNNFQAPLVTRTTELKEQEPEENDKNTIFGSYSCLWRQTQTRKHKTWDGDGILIIAKTKVTVQDETGKTLMSCPYNEKQTKFDFDEPIKIGSLDVQVEEKLSANNIADNKKNARTSSTLDLQQLPSISVYSESATVNRVFKPLIRHPSRKASELKSASASNQPLQQTSELESPNANAFRAPHVFRQPLRTTFESGDLNTLRQPPLPTSGTEKQFQPTIQTVQTVNCLWRRSKTNKTTWDGDGTLQSNGSIISLRDKNKNKMLGSKESIENILDVPMPYRISEFEIMIDNDNDNPNGISNVQKPSRTFVPLHSNTSKHSHVGLSSRPTNQKLKPLHDPKAENATVLPRPSEKYVDRHGKSFDYIDVVLDPLLANKLRPHQKSAIIFMYRCVMGMLREGNGCILADEMGMGKTASAISLIWTLLKQSPIPNSQSIIQRALVVCPVSIVKNWVREFASWLGKDRVRVFAIDAQTDVQNFGLSPANKVIIIGYERLRQVVNQLNNAQPQFGLLICDEGHRLKAAGGKTLSALKDLKVSRRIILSGTPIQNDLSEFHTMADFVIPGCFDSYNTFKQYFEVPILKSREPNCSEKHLALGKARSDQLSQIARSFVLRRTSQVLSKHLPPKHEYVVFCTPSDIQINLYKAVLESNIVKNMCSSGAQGTQHLRVITMMRKISNSPGLLRNTKSDKVPDELKDLVLRIEDTDEINISGKLIVLHELLSHIKRNTKEKVLVISNFTQTLNILEHQCRLKKYSFCRLDGNTNAQKRNSIVERFNVASQMEQFIFLLSSKAGGTGLNIVGASRLVLFDLDWNPANDLQAMARIHRDGQRRETHIYRLLSSGTIDEKIFQRQIIKTGLSGSLIDNADVAQSKNTFTLEELRDIFSLDVNTISNTHDIVGCPNCQGLDCAGSSAGNSSQELYLKTPAPSFISAAAVPDERLEKLRRRREQLSQLLDWTSIHCDDGVEMVKIADEALFKLVNGQHSNILRRNNDSQDLELQPGCVTFIFQR